MQLDEMLKHAQLTLEDEFEMEKYRQIALNADPATVASLMAQMYRLYMQYRRMLIYMIKTTNNQEQPINGNRL